MSIVTALSFSLNLLLVILCLGSLWFYSYAIYGAIDWLRSAPTYAPTQSEPTFQPPVTLLKPLCGLDAEMDENLASFCQQDYPQYQIIFAVQNSADPSLEVVQRLIQQFPDQDIQVVVSDRAIGANPKINNLANAATQAKYDLWLLADSDIQVGSDYLNRVLHPFRDPVVGVVTCPYRALAKGWVTRLEALETAAGFYSGVMVARKLEGVNFAFGSTIAIRQAALEKIGGWEAIVDYLADDYQLGHLPTTVGYKAILSDYVVDHRLGSSTFLDSLWRQIRWVRGTRASRPWGYLGMLITYGAIASPLLLLTTGGAMWSWGIAGLVGSVRLAAAWTIGSLCLNDQTTRRFWWLAPFRDWLSFFIWLSGFVGSTIEWRGERFKLLPGGKLLPLSHASADMMAR